MFAIEVCMPADPVSAAWLNAVMLSVPSWSSLSIASLKSSTDIFPLCRALYRSMVDEPAPSIYSDTCLSCPGMTSWSVCHDSSSNLPLPRDFEYCSKARAASSAPAPAATVMSLNAKPSCVALSRSPVEAASCCTIETIESVAVGSPCSLSLMRLIEFCATSAS